MKKHGRGGRQAMTECDRRVRNAHASRRSAGDRRGPRRSATSSISLLFPPSISDYSRLEIQDLPGNPVYPTITGSVHAHSPGARGYRCSPNMYIKTLTIQGFKSCKSCLSVVLRLGLIICVCRPRSDAD